MSYNSFSAWYIGQKVLCIDGSFPACVWEYCDAVPVAGKIYTIRRVYRSPNHTSGNLCISFYLEEIVNPAIGKALETGFSYARFRPLEETISNEESLHIAEPLELALGVSVQILTE